MTVNVGSATADESTRHTSRWDRLASLRGVAFFVVLLVSSISGGETPVDHASGRAVLSDPVQPPFSRHQHDRRVRRSGITLRTVLLALALSALATGCGGGGSSGSRQTDRSRPGTPNMSSAWGIIALGDSDATGKGDITGVGWVQRYARLLRHRLQAKVDVTNLAANGKTSAQLLAQVQTDPAVRRQIAEANIVLLGIGGADLNAGDDALQAGRCHGRGCYAPLLTQFAHNFAATVATIRKLRGARPTLLRAITLPNALPGAQDVIPPFVTPAITLYQARAEKQAICAAMAKYQGRCIDLLRAFNGPSGTENAYNKRLMNHTDCCYASAQGQQLMAELLLRTGLAPLR